MKKYNIYTAALAVTAMAFTACEKDGDMIYVDSVTDTEMTSTAKDIILDENHLDRLVLSVYWNENGQITLTDPMVAAPTDAVTNTLQLSAAEDFNPVYEETLGNGITYRQFNCGELNSAAIRGGMESGQTATVYLRMKSVLGANMEPTYSNVISFKLTTYMVDMSVGKILDKTKVDTGRTLALTDRENVFAGFFGAASWENWFFQTPDGEVWGTASDPGKAFVLGRASRDADLWNLWFPEPAGCYFVTMDLPANEWNALLVGSLTLGGDLQGEMAFDRKTNKWTYTFNAEAKTYNLTLSGTANRYDSSAGDGAPAQTDLPVGFAGAADALTFGSAAQPVAVTIESAGETTLILDLDNSKQWTLSAGEGAPEPGEVVPEYIYLPGITDPWDFNTTLKLYNEDIKGYGGVNYVKSEWGYKIAMEADNWDDVYTMAAGGNAFEGQLEHAGENNIWAPDEGIYLFDVNMSELKYKLVQVSSVSYTGLNDDWNLYPMQATDQPCVFTAEVEKTANTPWGVKIIINENWDYFFGGNGVDSEMVLYRDGFTGDNEFDNGTLILTVDLAKGTYSYTKK